MPRVLKSKIRILNVLVILIGINICAGLVIYILAGGRGSLLLEELLLVAGLLLTLIGMGAMLLYMILKRSAS